jgi:hypothetical protein
VFKKITICIYSLAYSRLYGIDVYGSAPASHLGKLVKLDKIMRILQYKDNKSYVGRLYKTFGTLPVSDLDELQIATFVEKVLHHFYEVPIVLNDYFVANDELHTYNTIRKDNIVYD